MTSRRSRRCSTSLRARPARRSRCRSSTTASTVPKTIQVSLFGPAADPAGSGSPTRPRRVLTILNDDPPLAHVAGNPLGLATAPTGGNPLTGASFFVDPQSEAANAAKSVSGAQRDRRASPTSRTSAPSAAPTSGSRSRTTSTARPSRRPARCRCWRPTGSSTATAATGRTRPRAAGLPQLHRGLRPGIGSYRAVLFLEMDSLITVGCLSHHGLAVRVHELDDAINILTANCPHLVIYLDAGAADALPAARTARLLRRAGVAKIQGFFLNSTHFDWTSNEIRYGEQISRMTGGKHFVVNTGRERPRTAAPARPRPPRQRGPLQPARPRPRPAAHREHRLPQRRHVRVDQQPGRVRRALRRGRPAHRRVLAGATRSSWSRTRTSRSASGGGRPAGRAIVPQPTTRSPSIRQASWPGAAPSASSASSTVSAGACRPRAARARDAASGRER